MGIGDCVGGSTPIAYKSFEGKEVIVILVRLKKDKYISETSR